MKVWFVLSISCESCNRTSIAAYSHKPTEDEKRKVIDECGGMSCINTRTMCVEIDGFPKTMEIIK